MEKTNVETGIVIPIYQERFIYDLINHISKYDYKNEFIICIVNDGNANLSGSLLKIKWPDNVDILNLPENRMFASANNLGWEYLVKKYPSIKLLGTINDDTIPQSGWLDSLIDALNKYPNTAIAAPIEVTREGFLRRKRRYATYILKNSDTPLICTNSDIDKDVFVPAITGFCFLARLDALERINYFDKEYCNSCEDVDISIKCLLDGWRIVVCKNSLVFHYGSRSKYKKGANTNFDESHKRLFSKWGYDLTRFNNINNEGFLII